MTRSELFKPDLRGWMMSLRQGETYLYLLSGVFWISGLFHPALGFLFYLSLLFPVLKLYEKTLEPAPLFFFLLPYYLTIGIGVWLQIFPLGLGILLAVLLCDLTAKLLSLFLSSATRTGALRILLLPSALALLDAIFQKIPLFSAVEMIPVLAPVYHHTPVLAAAAWVGRHLTYLILITATTGMGLLVYFAVAKSPLITFRDKKAVSLLTLASALALITAFMAAPVPRHQTDTATVMAVQASLGFHQENRHLSGEELFRFNDDRYRALSGAPDADLVLFPEIMVGIYDTEGEVDGDDRERFILRATAWNTILVPTVLEGNSRTRSLQDRRITSLVIDNTGILGRSSKRNLVPFSESRQFGPGRDYEAIPTPLGRVGLSICFDANSQTIRRLAADQAQLILAPFNNTGFSRVFHTVHRFYTIIQAVEYQIPIVVANESGISQIVDQTGRVLAELPIGYKGTITATVALSNHPSPYLLFGFIWEGLALFGLLWLRFRKNQHP